MFVTYIVAAFMAGPNWGEVAVDLVVPNIQNDPSYVSLVVATIGTTIAPWMIFLAQNNVVVRMRARTTSCCSVLIP